MGQQPLDNADAGDDGLAGAQSDIQIIGYAQQQDNQDTQPEQQTPIAPQEGIVLHVLRAEELLHMCGINLYPNDFQRQALAFVRLAVDLDNKWRQIVERIVKRRQCVDHLAVDETVVPTLDAQLSTLQHLDAGDYLLCGFEDGKLCLGALLHRGRHGDVSLLSDEYLNGVDGGLDGDLRLGGQHRCCQ